MAGTIDLKKEQAATLARPCVPFTSMARLLFWGMDVLYGKKTTLPKVRLLEVLARIPYQAWETRQYSLLSHAYADDGGVSTADEIIAWGRQAQDNEFWHLRTIEKRMRKHGIVEHPLRRVVVARLACFKYALFSRMLARTSLRRAFHMNAEFEDHAEHVYMQFVADHPALDSETVGDPVVDSVGGPYASWGDVFRRIALDERDHRNESFRHCGMAEKVVPCLDAQQG